MNIGDRVRVSLEMKISQMEQHVSSDEIILSGTAYLPDGKTVYCRVPLASSELVKAGMESVLRETYNVKPVAS